MGQHLVTTFIVLAATTFTVVANLTLKIAAGRPGIGSVWPLSVLNVRVFAAAAAFAMAFVFYAMLLRRLPLNLAQAIMAMQFVMVILAANVLLQEPIGTARWFGVALMALGLAVIGMAPESPG